MITLEPLEISPQNVQGIISVVERADKFEYGYVGVHGWWLKDSGVRVLLQVKFSCSLGEHLNWQDSSSTEKHALFCILCQVTTVSNLFTAFASVSKQYDLWSDAIKRD